MRCSYWHFHPVTSAGGCKPVNRPLICQHWIRIGTILVASSESGPALWRHGAGTRQIIPNEHYSDVIINAMVSQILTVCPTVCSGSKKTPNIRVTCLCEGIHRWLVDSLHKGSVMRKMIPFDVVIMKKERFLSIYTTHAFWCLVNCEKKFQTQIRGWRPTPTPNQPQPFKTLLHIWPTYG